MDDYLKPNFKWVLCCHDMIEDMDLHNLLEFQVSLVVAFLATVVSPDQFPQYPQGYYPFEESPAKIPPKVRKPPYLQTQVHCPGKAKSFKPCILILHDSLKILSL